MTDSFSVISFTEAPLPQLLSLAVQPAPQRVLAVIQGFSLKNYKRPLWLSKLFPATEMFLSLPQIHSLSSCRQPLYGIYLLWSILRCISWKKEAKKGLIFFQKQQKCDTSFIIWTTSETEEQTLTSINTKIKTRVQTQHKQQLVWAHHVLFLILSSEEMSHDAQMCRVTHKSSFLAGYFFQSIFNHTDGGNGILWNLILANPQSPLQRWEDDHVSSNASIRPLYNRVVRWKPFCVKDIRRPAWSLPHKPHVW